MRTTETRRRARRALLVVLTALGAVGLAAGPAAATGTLDQSSEGTSASAPIDFWRYVGQSFTAGITGDLDQVDLVLARDADDASGVVELRTLGADGLPTETILARATVGAEAIPTQAGFVPVPIDPVPVTAGTQYAIVLHGHGFRQHGDFAGRYPGGQALQVIGEGPWTVATGNDLAFHTYVTVPPPAQPPCRILRLRLFVPRTPIVVCI
jgi:hypothetical protein